MDSLPPFFNTGFTRKRAFSGPQELPCKVYANLDNQKRSRYRPDIMSPRTTDADDLFKEYIGMRSRGLSSPICVREDSLNNKSELLALYISVNLQDGVALSTLSTEELQRLCFVLSFNKDDEAKMEEIKAELNQRLLMAENETLELDWGTVCRTVVEETGGPIDSDIHVTAEWSLTKGMAYCAGCRNSLGFKNKYNRDVGVISFYQPVCGHALRYCEMCDYHPCHMCGNSQLKEKKTVFQSEQSHSTCINSPCQTCKNL